MTDLAQHLKATFLSLLPADGATKGNGALRREIEEQLSKDGLSITEEQYWQVHAELIASGVVATGKGRGGSVRLVDAQPDSFGLATQVVEAEEIELFFLPARNQDELERGVRSVMRRLQLHPERIRSYFRHPRIAYAAWLGVFDCQVNKNDHCLLTGPASWLAHPCAGQFLLRLPSAAQVAAPRSPLRSCLFP